MAEKCPFCWDESVKPVYQGKGNYSGGATRRLMECRDCEKWYWADSGKEVPGLFMVCETSVISPGKCYEEIRELLNSGGNGFPRRRLAEFNHLCSECPEKEFGTIKSHLREPKNSDIMPL